MTDPRLETPRWDAAAGDRPRVRLLTAVGLIGAVVYFAWLLSPGRVGNPWLYGLLVAAELFNAVQAFGFWWTCWRERDRRPRTWTGPRVEVDVLVPVYGEPVEVVEPTIAGAAAMRGADVTVHLLDDGADEEMRALAARHGARYVRRPEHTGAKAGNINYALARTSAPFVVVLDSDHVPRPEFLEATLGHLADPMVAFVQTPQYYANARARGGVTAAAWAQQALFFGAIARGKDGRGAMFCCGTNVVFRRTALEHVGGFPEGSLTEDFELSVRLHERRWRTAYVPRVLACGLGPEDMSSFVSQQHRWARGCLTAIGTVLRSRMPWRLRAQYLLSSMYFLSGWTLVAYMAFPIVRILTGLQPLATTGADQFLVHFAPYFGLALLTVAVAGAGSYTWAAFALQSASFWIHVHASLMTLLRRRGRFVVTPKRGAAGRQPLTVLPALGAATALVAVGVYGLVQTRSPAMLNNVAFAALHVSVQLSGAWPALRGRPREEERSAERLERAWAA
jgi:cellulose synthase (UDP-forming)